MTKYIVTGIILGGLIILAIEYWPEEPQKEIKEIPPVVTEPEKEAVVVPVVEEINATEVEPEVERV